MFLPAIFSLSGTSLSSDEYHFFREVQPFGFILFGRNIDTPDQVKKLNDQLNECIGRSCPILIDQEGGRVQRLKPPHWHARQPMQACGSNIEQLDAAINGMCIELKELGINTNCAPVLDVLCDDTDISIGDRAFSGDPEKVSRLGAHTCAMMLRHGIRPVIKHLPGHGRAKVDSHDQIPYIDASLEELTNTDFPPFIHCMEQSFSTELWGMVAHCCYTAIDADLPASLSPHLIQTIIRGEIGFTNLLMSDDLSMGALQNFGTIEERARKCLDAGCDIALYCAGELPEMISIAETIS
jgi:beta-N-acetylhexosaminidase